MAEGWAYAIEFRKERISLREGTLTLGRSRQCEVPIADPSVSRQHARLRIQAAEIVLEDLGSSNGTLVNGHRVQGQIELQDQDRIEMGDAVLRLFVEAPQSEGVEPQDSPLQTVRMPTVDSGLPQPPGDATFFLQSASVELAKQALSDSADEIASESAGQASPFFSAPPELPAPDLPAVTQRLPEHSFADIFPGRPLPPVATQSPASAPAAPRPEPRFRAPTDELATEELAVAQEKTALPPHSSPSPPSSPTGPRLTTTELPSPPDAVSAPTTMPLPVARQASASSPALPPETVPAKTPAPETLAPEASAAPLPAATTTLPGLDDFAGEPSWDPASRSAPRRQDILPTLDELEAAIGPQLPDLPIPRPAPQAGSGSAQATPLEPVGFWRRALALILDNLWIMALSLGAALAWGGPLTPEGQQIAAVFASGIAFFVFLIGWGFWGTTPGKRLLGLYVCTLDGSPGIGLGRASMRMLGFLLSTVFFGLGFLMVAFGSSKRALHDLLAGTYVGSR